MVKPVTPAPATGGASKMQLAIAVVGLVGVLGAALIANWDKLSADPADKKAAKPAAPPVQVAASTGPQSAVVSGVTGNVTVNIAPTPTPSSAPTVDDLARLVGTWISEPAANPYAQNQLLRLRLSFSRFGGEVVGTVADIREGATDGHRFDILALQGDGSVVTFHTRSTVCCDSAGNSTPYRMNYRVELKDSRLMITRVDDLANGGIVQRLVASKASN